MKKSTIIILLVVFVLSVIVVGIFGMKIMSYNVKLYIKEILPTNVTLYDAEGNPTIYTYYADGNSGDKNQIRKNTDPDQPNTYYIRVPYSEGMTLIADYEITPNDATNRKLKIAITYDSKGGVEGAGVTNSNSAEIKNNVITFKQKASVDITFRATDGSNVVMKLCIYMK